MFEGHYKDWRSSRMNGIKKYVNLDLLKGRTLLEVGCGYADNGNMFSELGFQVSSCDARKEHIDIAKQRYPHLNLFVFDSDKQMLPHDETLKYDVILHWGLLYHLSDVRTHLKNICSHCDYLFLETEVSDSNDENFVLQTTEHGYDQAFNQIGSRPSERFIEKCLEEEGFQYKKILDDILNSSIHVYDWEIENTGTWRHGLRRFWICWKKTTPSCLQ